eukprot:Sdes_comp18618_c2_seq1m8789
MASAFFLQDLCNFIPTSKHDGLEPSIDSKAVPSCLSFENSDSYDSDGFQNPNNPTLASLSCFEEQEQDYVNINSYFNPDFINFDQFSTPTDPGRSSILSCGDCNETPPEPFHTDSDDEMIGNYNPQNSHLSPRLQRSLLLPSQRPPQHTQNHSPYYCSSKLDESSTKALLLHSSKLPMGAGRAHLRETLDEEMEDGKEESVLKSVKDSYHDIIGSDPLSETSPPFLVNPLSIMSAMDNSLLVAATNVDIHSGTVSSCSSSSSSSSSSTASSSSTFSSLSLLSSVSSQGDESILKLSCDTKSRKRKSAHVASSHQPFLSATQLTAKSSSKGKSLGSQTQNGTGSSTNRISRSRGDKLDNVRSTDSGFCSPSASPSSLGNGKDPSLSSTHGNGKSGYASNSLSACASKISKRTNANERERKRVKDINLGFEELKQMLPSNTDKHSSKVDILKMTRDYISLLENKILQLENNIKT